MSDQICAYVVAHADEAIEVDDTLKCRHKLLGFGKSVPLHMDGAFVGCTGDALDVRFRAVIDGKPLGEHVDLDGVDAWDGATERMTFAREEDRYAVRTDAFAFELVWDADRAAPRVRVENRTGRCESENVLDVRGR